MLSSTTYHVQIHIPARSLRSGGDGGPNNIHSLMSRSDGKDKSLCGARTSRRTQMVFLHTLKTSNSS